MNSMTLFRTVRSLMLFVSIITCTFLLLFHPEWRKRDVCTSKENVSEELGTRRSLGENGNLTNRGYNWAAAAMRFHHRKEHLRKQCDWKPEVHLKRIWQLNPNFLVDVPRHLLICAVPKSGSTSWHRLLWILQRKRGGLNTDQSLYTSKDTLRNQAMAKNLTIAQGTRLIRRVIGDDRFWQEPPAGSSFRVILVRHPFARLISGWNQKFMLRSNYWAYLFLSHRGLIDYKKEIDMNHVMSFRDFASYVADVSHSGRLDFHFVPARALCRPCANDYIYIVKAESIDKDEPWLLRRLKLDHIRMGRKGIPPGGSLVNDDPVESIRKYMKEIEPEVIKKLYNFYKDDFEIFGYTFNFTTLEAGGFE